MTDRAAVMPDFVDRLEHELRAEGVRIAAAVPGTRRRGRSSARLASALALGAVAAVVAVSSVGDGTPAYAGPLIVKAPASDAPDAREVAQHLAGGLTARYVLGGDVTFDQVREVATPAGPAFAVGGSRGWCLSVPDAASPNPSQERGVGCAVPVDFDRIGLSVRVGGQYVAVLPQGVRDPVLRRVSGSTSALAPSRYGVVTAAVRPGDTVTMFDTAGRERRDRVPGA